ncbi:MAG: hypothetical protein ACOCWA_03195 [Bacteroidota bacterium]
MRRIIYILFLFISSNCFSQLESDSARYERMILNTRYELEELYGNYRDLQQSYSILKADTDTLGIELMNRDSLNEKYVNLLNLRIDSLESVITHNYEIFTEANDELRQELHKTRKGNATLLIIIFSLLVLNFVYLVYRNYRLKTYVNNELLSTSLDMERKHSKLRKKSRKRFAAFSRSINKKLKKQTHRTKSKKK